MSTAPFLLPVSYYEAIITSEYRPAPNFALWLQNNLQLINDISVCLQTFGMSFALQTATGVQLDVLGTILGASRILPFQPTGPINQAVVNGGGTGYAIGDTVQVDQGYGFGSVLAVTAETGGVAEGFLGLTNQGNNYASGIALPTTTLTGSGSGMTVNLLVEPPPAVLTDTDFRTYLKCQVIQNHWNGQIDQLQTLWTPIFGPNTISITDNGVSGTISATPTGSTINASPNITISSGAGVATGQLVQASYEVLSTSGTLHGVALSVSSVVGVELGQLVTGSEIPSNTYVLQVNGGAVILSQGVHGIIGTTANFYAQIFPPNTYVSSGSGTTWMLSQNATATVASTASFSFTTLPSEPMSATITIGAALTSIFIDLIFNGFIVPRPMGVGYSYVLATSLPFFGFDRNDAYIGGFDTGKFVG